MVLAAVCLDTRTAQKLTQRGLRDSKAYGSGQRARAQRAQLAAEIQQSALSCELVVVDVATIDSRVQKRELNVLEREVAQDLIERSPACARILADGKQLFQPLTARYPTLQALDRAESQHAAVAAASILAKDQRDRIFARIAERYHPLFGPIRGGGYNNSATREFLRAYAKRFGDLPAEARRSWPYSYLCDILGENYDPLAKPLSPPRERP